MLGEVIEKYRQLTHESPDPEHFSESLGLLVDARLVEFVAYRVGLTPHGRKFLRKAGLAFDISRPGKITALLRRIPQNDLGDGTDPAPSEDDIRAALVDRSYMGNVIDDEDYDESDEEDEDYEDEDYEDEDDEGEFADYDESEEDEEDEDHDDSGEDEGEDHEEGSTVESSIGAGRFGLSGTEHDEIPEDEDEVDEGPEDEEDHDGQADRRQGRFGGLFRRR